MIIYVSGAPRDGRGNWFGARYLPDIQAILGGPGNTLHLPANDVSERMRPEEVYSLVLMRIRGCDCGVTFLGANSSGSIVEASMLASLGKSQAIIADSKILGSHLLRGLPAVVGFADYEQERSVLLLLQQLQGRSLFAE
jgi:hypothetical protein